jgi:hypothetical protein
MEHLNTKTLSPDDIIGRRNSSTSKKSIGGKIVVAVNGGKSWVVKL